MPDESIRAGTDAFAPSMALRIQRLEARIAELTRLAAGLPRGPLAIDTDATLSRIDAVSAAIRNLLPLITARQGEATIPSATVTPTTTQGDTIASVLAAVRARAAALQAYQDGLETLGTLTTAQQAQIDAYQTQITTLTTQVATLSGIVGARGTGTFGDAIGFTGTGMWLSYNSLLILTNAKADIGTIGDTGTLKDDVAEDLAAYRRSIVGLRTRASLLGNRLRQVSQMWHTHERASTDPRNPAVSTLRLRSASFDWVGIFGVDLGPPGFIDPSTGMFVPSPLLRGTPLRRLMTRQHNVDEVDSIWPDEDVVVLFYTLDSGLQNNVADPVPWVPPRDPIAQAIGAVTLLPLVIIGAGAVLGVAGVGLSTLGGTAVITGTSGSIAIGTGGGAAFIFTGSSLSVGIGGLFITMSGLAGFAAVAGTVLGTAAIAALGITGQIIAGATGSIDFVITFDRTFVSSFDPSYTTAALLPTVIPPITG